MAQGGQTQKAICLGMLTDKKTLDPLRCTQRLAFGGGGTRKDASHIAEKRKRPASPGQRQNARPYLYLPHIYGYYQKTSLHHVLTVKNAKN